MITYSLVDPERIIVEKDHDDEMPKDILEDNVTDDFEIFYLLSGQILILESIETKTEVTRNSLAEIHLGRKAYGNCIICDKEQVPYLLEKVK